MICLTSLASESAIGASAIRLEYREIVGSRYCPDGRFGWLAPIAAWPPDTRPLTLANLPQASARSQAGGPGASLSSRALFSEIGVPDPPIGAGANWPGNPGLGGRRYLQNLHQHERPFVDLGSHRHLNAPVGASRNLLPELKEPRKVPPRRDPCLS